MMKSFVIAFLVVASISSVFCQVYSNKPCPTDRPVQEDFNITRYAGIWYEQARYNSGPFLGCECSYSQYTLQSNDSMLYSVCCKRLPIRLPSCYNGIGKVTVPATDNVEAKMSFTLGLRPSENTNYVVMSTDYDNYAVVYFCRDVGSTRSADLFWLYSRQKELVPEVKSKVDDMIDTYFMRDRLKITEQSVEKCV